MSQFNPAAFNVCTNCRLAMDDGDVRCTRCGGALTRSDPRLFIGESFGRYELLDVIGTGGMGVVLKARHRTLGHDVAIKLLRPGAVDAQLRERFLREARLLAGLQHPNIVLIHDFDVSDWGVPYYVMEYLEGHGLAAEIARHPDGLGWPRVSEVLHGVVDALAFAHAHGIVHRDLKPDNIFVAQKNGEEQIKLLDFGIARYLEDDDDSARLTQAGFVVGTPLYFAPEQFFGYPVTLATDQFALALIVAEMVRGKPMRNGRSFSEISFEGLAHSATDVSTRLPGGLSPAAIAAIGRALKVDPAARFPDVSSFAQALGLERKSLTPPRVAPTGLAETRLAPQLKASSADSPFTRARPLRTKTWPIAALVAFLVLAVIAWRFVHAPTGASHGSDAVTTTGAAAWLRPRQEFGVPVDARMILGQRADVVVLGSADGWYLRPLDAGVEASRVVLPADQKLIGSLEDGRLAIVIGDALQAVDPLTREATPLGKSPAGIAAKAIVRISPDGRTALARQGDELLLFRPGSAVAPRRIASPAGSEIALSRTYLAIATGARVRVLKSSDASPVLDEALDLGDISDLALLDNPPRLGVAGREPEIRLLTLDGSAPVQTIPVQRGARSLAWNADGPSLIVAGNAGLSVWRNGAFLPEHYANAAQQKELLHADGGGALLLDGDTHRLALFDTGNLPIARKYTLGTSESWAVHVDAERATVHVGSSNGTVYSLTGDQVTPHPLHADGVTALAGDATHLASASDDRTVAIWNLPDMTVEWRSRSHDYLVNQIALVGAHLWSSSSDGTLKSWRWPTLEEEQTIDLRALSGAKDLRLHAFWIDPSQTLALVGTWNGRLIALDRRGSSWVAKSLPIASSGGYHLIGVPGVHGVVVQGTQPSRLYAYDLDSQRLFDLPDLGHTYYTLTSDGSPDGVLVGGVGVVARYQLERTADNGLAVTVDARAQSDLGSLTAADFDPAQKRLWAADDKGRLFAIDTGHWSPPAAFRTVLRPTDAP